MHQQYSMKCFINKCRQLIAGPVGSNLVSRYGDGTESANPLDLPDGDDTAGQTGFKTVNFVIPVTEGEGEYRINISDQEDGLYDSVLLIASSSFPSLSFPDASIAVTCL